VIKDSIDEKNQNFYSNILFLILLILSCVGNLAKTADDLKIFSKFSIFILLYLGLVLVFETPAYKNEK